MSQHLRRIGATDDTGSALVATVGVALIGMAFSLIVVSSAISITNDAARDRVRTVEIHAAEAALDAAFQTIETSTPCSTSMTVGEDSSYAVDVTVTIEYFNGNTPVPCDNGVLTGIPTGATLTSSAVPVYEAPGAVSPQRQIIGEVNLVPVMEPSLGVAIFSGGSMNVANSGEILPLDPDEPARVWVENQDFNCSNSFLLDADLIVTDGRINMANTCQITGSAWTRKGLTASNNVNPYRIGGDVVIFDGDLTGTAQKWGGSMSVDGSIWVPLTVEESICSDNVGSPCGPLPEYTSRGLPTVTYNPSDWPSSFVVKDKAAWAEDVIATAGMNASDADAFRLNPCALSSKIKNPIELTSQDSIYNLLTCAPLSSSGSVTIVINADTAFFVDGFAVQNQFLIKSGDGEEHNVWFIVPTGYTGSISMSNSEYIVPPIHVFLFTPNAINFANSTEMVGQAYGTNINMSNSLDFLYAGMGIPGVELGDPTSSTSAASFSVEIVSKREYHN